LELATGQVALQLWQIPFTKKKYMSKKSFNVNWLFLIVPVIIIAAAISFTFGKDGYGHGITGAQALSYESGWFWFFVVLGILVAGALVYLALRNVRNEGKTSTTIVLIALAVVCFFGPFGKGCTDKANQGVTAPHYQSIK
jgi:hypothetical protein